MGAGVEGKYCVVHGGGPGRIDPASTRASDKEDVLLFLVGTMENNNVATPHRSNQAWCKARFLLFRSVPVWDSSKGETGG